MGGRTDGWGLVEEWVDEWMGGRTDGWGLVEEWVDEWMGGRTNGWMEGRMDGNWWRDGWTDERRIVALIFGNLYGHLLLQ
jgi:hypothetical protein